MAEEIPAIFLSGYRGRVEIRWLGMTDEELWRDDEFVACISRQMAREGLTREEMRVAKKRLQDIAADHREVESGKDGSGDT